MRQLLLVTLLFLSISTLALAQVGGNENLPYGIIMAEQARSSFTIIGAGARAAGMGGAFTAVADDATAASFNPAGLAQLMVSEASVVASHPRYADEYRDFISFGDPVDQLLGDAVVDHDHLSLNFLSATVPFQFAKRHWAVQLSRHRLVDFEYDGAVEFLASGQSGQTLATISQSSSHRGDISISSGSLAVELTQRTLLGLTVNYWDGDWGFDSYNGRRSAANPSNFYQLRYQQQSTLSAWNVDIGLLLRYPRFNLGVRYRTPFDGDYTLSAQGDLSRGTIAGDLPDPVSGIETTMHWPGTVNVGLALKLSDRWLLAADWGRTDWSRLTIDVPVVDEYGARLVPHNFFDLAPEEYTDTREAEDLHIGTEYLFFIGDTVIPVRAGWFREPHPSRDLWTGQGLRGEGYSIGVGIKRGAIAADLAVRRKTADAWVSRFFLPRDLEGSELALLPNSVGRLKREELSVFVSMIIQFPKGSGHSNLLHKIFVGPVNDDD